MNERSLFVAPHPTTHIDDLDSRSYDALLCSLGYETRSVTAACRVAGSTPILAVGFTHRKDKVYKRNRELLVERGASIEEPDDQRFSSRIADWLDHGPTRVAIDISSMNRTRIATVVDALRHTANDDLVIDFIYVPQRYEKGPPKVEKASALEPVAANFAGWYTDASRPLVVLFGLGYEPLRAAGAIDVLEPKLAVPFFPVGKDEKFMRDVEANNKRVFSLPTVDPTRRYEIADPFSLFAELDSLVSFYDEEGSRLVLLPLGPKIFALVCILVASTRHPVTPVWRVSPGQREDPIDVQPDDQLVTLRVSTAPILSDPGGAGTEELEARL